MIRFSSMLPKAYLLSGLLSAWGTLPTYAVENKEMLLSGLGWVQYGHVAHSTDTVNLNTNGNTLQTLGAQISLFSQISEKLSGTAGLGVIENLPMAGGIEGGGRIPTNVTPYIAEASFHYSFWESEKSGLVLTGGLFHYNYNPDIQNLGLYLLRGPVYPGVVISGFETKHVLPISNILGFQLRHQSGGFMQDLILNSENELHPYFDVSPAYIAQYRFGNAFRIGAGVNFYHLIPIDKKLTSPDLDSVLLTQRMEQPEDKVKGPYDRVMIYVDTTGPKRDTTMLSFQGTKVMANFTFDPKAIWGQGEWLGPEDLKIYGEMAVIGLNTSKAYNALYGDLMHRMPVMMGFNLPMFRFLDHLSLEVEWYGAKFKDDYSRYRSGVRSFYESPIPVSNSFLSRSPQAYIDPVTGAKSTVVSGTTIPFDQADVEKSQYRDNWKWSLHGSKIIQNHFKVSFQVANDHLRPGGTQDQPSFDAVLTTPKDWYWMTKVGYFF
ncbi:MAG TPA: hypothetical protein VJ385_10645 [Fibrobacteria bacterium]|nr:hypothetical protein [Fibrobacteria bacterium]